MHSSNFSCNKYPLGSTENYDKIISSLSEGIQKFDSYFNEKSCDLSPYDVRQTQIVTMQIKDKFLALQDSLKPKKKFGFKSKTKKVTLMPAEYYHDINLINRVVIKTIT